MDNFDPYNVLLVIATNIPVLLMTGFVLQGHIYSSGDVDVFSDSVCWCIKAETMILSSVVANRVQQNL